MTAPTKVRQERARSIDGNKSAGTLRAQIAAQVRWLQDSHGITPGLAVVLVGEDPASRVYVRNKEQRATEVGMNSFVHRLPAETSESSLVALVQGLNNDPAVHGVLVQMPLPPHIDENVVLLAIDPGKDVDGFHPENAGALATGAQGMVPCTPLGCVRLLRETLGSLDGLRAVVVGRSNIVGKPMAQLLLRENCTVVMAHSRTRDLPAETRQADIVVAAVGKPHLIKGSWLKPGAVVIDVGINRVERPDGKPFLVGDVDYDDAAAVAGAITPVPGGVGPMTIACLLQNTLVASLRQNGLSIPPSTALP